MITPNVLELPANASEIIEGNVARLVSLLTDWSRHMAARFNGPVYLVGSTLHNPQPRDTDIRIVVADDEFSARYEIATRIVEYNEFHKYHKRGLVSGPAVPWGRDEGACPSQRWVDDVAKFGAFLSKQLKLNVDMKVVPDSWWRDRIYPAPILLASPSPSWFVYSSLVPDPSLAETDTSSGSPPSSGSRA